MPHRLVVYGYPPGADRDLSVMSAIPRLCRVLGDRYRIDLELWVARGATEYPAYHAILMRFLDERRSAGSSTLSYLNDCRKRQELVREAV